MPLNLWGKKATNLPLALKAASLPDSGFPSFSSILAWPCIPPEWPSSHGCSIPVWSHPSPSLPKLCSAPAEAGPGKGRHSPGSQTSCHERGRGQWGSWPETEGRGPAVCVPGQAPTPRTASLVVASAPGLWELSPPVFVSCTISSSHLLLISGFFSSVWLLRASNTCETTCLHYVPFAVNHLKWLPFMDTLSDVPTAPESKFIFTFCT